MLRRLLVFEIRWYRSNRFPVLALKEANNDRTALKRRLEARNSHGHGKS